MAAGDLYLKSTTDKGKTLNDLLLRSADDRMRWNRKIIGITTYSKINSIETVNITEVNEVA